MNWRHLRPSPDGTHHTLEGRPCYERRFDEVLAFHEPGLAPVRLGSEAWHIHVHGGEAYARRFRRTFGFYEGRAAVMDEGGWHHILPDGTDLYPERYAWCGNYQGQRCAVRDAEGLYRYLTPEGRPAGASRWRYAGDYREAIAVVQDRSGLSTHVDREGVPLHGQRFLDLDVFHKGFARARDARGWTHVDRKGRPVCERRFAMVEPFYNGQARVERFDGGLEVIDEAGQTVVELRPARLSELAALSADMVGSWRTDTIATAVRLGLFEALPGSTSELATRCELPTERAARLLRALDELRLVRARPEGTWESTPRGEYLRASHPLTLADAALEYAGPLRERWQSLGEALRAESWQPEDLFRQVAGSETRRATHHRMLRSYALHDYLPLVPLLPVSAGQVVVDAGGGTGALATLLARQHPGAELVVLDLPGVVAELTASSAAPGVRGVGADFFEPWPLTADLVLLARVLHDWDDRKAVQLLRQARAALRPGGRLIALEMVLDEQSPDGGLCDLHLLAVTGGQERTRGQFEQLFSAAGLRLERLEPTPALPQLLVTVPA
ncbi:MAG TPA: methyltransferase [Myxococcaceae bacterium]|jgi:SAM-dependent methyltransferase